MPIRCRRLSTLQPGAVISSPSCRRLLQQIQATQKRAFARTGRSDDNDFLAFFDRFVDSFQHFMVAEAFFQSLDLNRNIAHISHFRIPLSLAVACLQRLFQLLLEERQNRHHKKIERGDEHQRNERVECPRTHQSRRLRDIDDRDITDD